MEQIQLTQLSLDDLRDILSEVLREQLKQIEKDQPDQLLTRKELAQKLKISFPTLSHYTKEGILISHKIGNRVYYRWSDVLNSAIKVEPQKSSR